MVKNDSRRVGEVCVDRMRIVYQLKDLMVVRVMLMSSEWCFDQEAGSVLVKDRFMRDEASTWQTKSG